jgi:hypothetical protein
MFFTKKPFVIPVLVPAVLALLLSAEQGQAQQRGCQRQSGNSRTGSLGRQGLSSLRQLNPLIQQALMASQQQGLNALFLQQQLNAVPQFGLNVLQQQQLNALLPQLIALAQQQQLDALQQQQLNVLVQQLNALLQQQQLNALQQQGLRALR